MPRKPPPVIVDATAGAIAAVATLVLLYPLDLYPNSPCSLTFPSLKTNLQASSTEKITTRSILLQRLKSHRSIQALYAGLPTACIQVASTQFTYFYFYATLRRLLFSHKPSSTLKELGVGACAGALAQLFTIPVAVVVTRQQTATTRTQSFLDAWRDILEQDGYRGLWRGLKASLVLVVNPAITYGFYQRLSDLILKSRSKSLRVSTQSQIKLSSMDVFVLSVIAKAIATVLTYPYILAKVRQQSKSISIPAKITTKPVYRQHSSVDTMNENTLVNNESNMEAWRILALVYKRHGLRGWYKVYLAFLLFCHILRDFFCRLVKQY